MITPEGVGDMQFVIIVKGREKFVIVYERGDESVALEQLVEWTRRKDLDFDWFDAARLSHQIGQYLAKELKSWLPAT